MKILNLMIFNAKKNRSTHADLFILILFFLILFQLINFILKLGNNVFQGFYFIFI